MTLQEVIAAVRKLSTEEKNILLDELQLGDFVPSASQREDLDRALRAADEGDVISGDEIRSMLQI